MFSSRLLAVHIEDSPQMRVAVKDFLRLLDIEVLNAGSARVGTDLILQHKPNIILLDLNLPDINGLEVCRSLRQHSHTRHIPIIMLSVEDDHATRQAALDAGANAYLIKSTMTDTLAESIQAAMGNLQTLPPVSEEDSTKFITGTYARIGQWFRKSPQEILPLLDNIPRQDWAQAIYNILKEGQTSARGQAVIALAAWQKEADAPYNFTPGQRFFWEHVRHSLASGSAEDAARTWAKMSPVALALMYPPQRIRKALERYALSNRNSECRRWGLRILLENHDAAAVDYAVAQMDDRSDGMRMTALMVLAELGEAQHIPLLTQAMNDRAGGVREQAAEALARINSPLAVVALAAALHDGAPQTAEAAANGLASLASDEAVTALAAGAEKRPETGVLVQIAHALGKAHTTHALNALARLAHHTDRTVSEIARKCLEQP